MLTRPAVSPLLCIFQPPTISKRAKVSTRRAKVSRWRVSVRLPLEAASKAGRSSQGQTDATSTLAIRNRTLMPRQRALPSKGICRAFTAKLRTRLSLNLLSKGRPTRKALTQSLSCGLGSKLPPSKAAVAAMVCERAVFLSLIFMQQQQQQQQEQPAFAVTHGWVGRRCMTCRVSRCV